MISEIYSAYEAESSDSLNSAVIYSKRLQSLIAEDRKEADGGEGKIDWNVFVNGSDYRITEANVDLISKDDQQAEVKATFKNFGDPQQVIFVLVKEDGRWAIDDVRSTMPGKLWSMSDTLESSSTIAAASPVPKPEIATNVASTSSGDAASNLLGIWAHSEADCQTKLSGRLDRDDLSRPERTRYELVGFCRHGMELLDQPVYCETEQIKNQSSGYRWSGRCEVKGDPFYPVSFRMRVTGANAISFNQNDFAPGNFSISGNYVRCSLTYKCTGASPH
jgi:hypothetical protein